jgi:predicted nucleic acid-binding protein
VISDVDILISGDKDFDDVKLEKPEIITPSEFINTYSV